MFLLIKKACIVKSNPRNSRNTSKYGLLCNWSWGYSTPKERSSVIYERAESNEGSTKETEAERVSYDGGSEIDCESGTSVVLLGHSSTHGLTARLKAMLRFKREPRRFGFFIFFMFTKHIYLFLCSHHLSICFSVFRHPVHCHWSHVGWRRRRRRSLPSLSSFRF